jgi:SAM-dependent methyltransferase
MRMDSDVSRLHDRYTIQAHWTADLRNNLLNRLDLPPHPKGLEVGSGTGCITSWVSTRWGERLWGIDIDWPIVRFARQRDQTNGYAQADGCDLPFPHATFDLIFSHFLLLWTTDPRQILMEMKRCLRPGGWIIAFAEPDYGARIDYPESLESIGEHQAEALRRQGASPMRGRELRALFSSIDLDHVSAGVIGGEWNPGSDMAFESEWSTLRDDLEGMLEPGELSRLESLDRTAWEKQQRILFTPTFYAMGQKA